MTNPEDFAPYPGREEDVTAEAMIRHSLVFAQVNGVFADLTINKSGFFAQRLWLTLNGVAVEKFSVASLLAELMEVDPERAEAAAKRMWSERFDGAVISELTWDRLNAAGIDPDEVAKVAGEAWQNAMTRKDVV